ncbi:MAG: type II toxin-antitoxin system HicA family toxin [Minisyncoccia bacterium]
MLFTDVSSGRAVRVFEKVGFWISSTRGKKHIGMTNGTRKLTIPRHIRLNPYTLKGIIKDAGLTDEQFKKLS